MSNLVLLSLNSGDFWLKMGFQHLLDFNGYDHMLFLWMSFLTFTFSQYKRAFFQVTLFTLAHSLTLAISVFQWFPFSTAWVERAIALSIALSALLPLINRYIKPQPSWVSGVLIFAFGLIHGMGFSGLLVSLLGHTESISMPLLFFNIGLELGQLLFVLLLLVVQTAIQKGWPQYTESYIRSAALVGLSLGLYLFMTRF
jgi:hypothetical protein